MMVRLTFGFLAILLGVDVIAAQNKLFWPWYYPDTYAEDMGAFVWNYRDSWIPDNYAPCVVRQGGVAGDLEGTCTLSVDCNLSGGRSFSRGNCSLLNTCCIYEKTCRQTVKARVAYFRQPRIPRQDTTRPCNLKVDTVNDNVCQMRVDIESMSLALPTLGDPASTVTCNGDRFTASISGVSKVKLPTLCGQNTNTHFYIHLVEGQKQVSLDFVLNAIGSGSSQAIDPSWQLKVTQLECPSREKIFDIAKKKENRNQASYDYERLAPEGCLQYYTEPSGTVKSFGYVGPTAAAPSTLTTSQNYAICFKNYANCGTMFSWIASNFNLAPEPASAADSCVNGYINVPGLETPRLCAATPVQVSATHAGPAYIEVLIPTTTEEDITVNRGFSWDYSTITNCNKI